MLEPSVIADRYRIIRKLGEGGFGVTYLAEEIRLERRIVVKLARTADEDLVQRFRTESTVLGRLRHPRIAAIYDSNVTEDGRPYLVLEWIDGPSLQERMAEEPLTLQQTMAVGLAVSEALQAAHAAGILHRDLKPTNVILPDGRYEKATLVDFGVYGELMRSPQQAEGVTRGGEFFGTPTYMAPEQLKAEPNSPATDVYGLGVLMYAMLFGQPPFWKENASVFEFMRRTLAEEVTFPKEPALPKDVRLFLKRCLEKDPAQRYPSMEAVRQALQEIVDSNRPGAAVPPPAAARPPKLADEHPAPPPVMARAPSKGRTWWIALPGVLVLAGLLWLAWTYRQVMVQTPGLFVGALLIVGGILIGLGVHRYLLRRKSEIEKDASKILEGAKTRSDLSLSMAIQVDELIRRCKDVDQRILGLTIARMVGEYDRAKDSNDRQAALMNAAQLLEKLMNRLSPWYIRHEKLIALTISFLGIVSGIISALVSLLKLVE